MKYRRLGSSGVRVSEVALGSWLTFGSSVEQATTTRCTRRALELGVNFVDTADVYMRGEAERHLGLALEGVPRRSLFLATKVFWPTGEGPNDRGLSRKHVFEALHESLANLRTDYVDLLQCHRYDPETPLPEVVRAMDDLIRQGKVLYWGVSCWTGAQIADACRTADLLGAPRPVSNQPPYSLLDRAIEPEVVPVSLREGLSQVVFSPLAQGVLTGKYRGGKPPAGSRGADEKRGVWMKKHLAPEATRKVEEFLRLAGEAGVPPARLALAWVLSRPGVASAIFGATRVEQVEENVAAVEVGVPPDLAARLDGIFPPPPAPPAP
ncbi:MAG: aldo/keto reductase family protein [Planctomycetaceae bacterium]|nr:aldo/keto reductase family protein [Planctomycetota bacterium]NUN51867.1 aldo/keto reductase family protein [Planctomycetaceae bacterium]